MATSGSITGTAKTNGSITTTYTFWAEWKRNGSYDIEKNTSNITVSLIIQKPAGNTEGAYNLDRYPTVSLSVNGSAKTPTISYIDTRNHAKCTFATWTGNVTHKDDGSLSCPISASFTHYGSSSLDAGSVSGKAALDTIPRASTLTSAANVTLGNKCSVKWTPKAAAFRYKLKFVLGNWNYTTGAIHPNKTSEYTYTGYTIPLDVAKQIPKSTGTMTVYLYTYSNSGATTQVGSASSKTFTVTVPDNSNTKPTVSMSLAPVSSLGSAFSGLYIQGKTKVKATLSAEGKYDANISSYSMKVDGTTYDSDDSYTSDLLNNVGGFTVYGYAKDSRGYTGSTSKSITVIGYVKPKILNVEALRCDKDGNLADNGTYLKIKAKRSYSPVKSGSVQKNFCQIRYRYKLSSASKYSEWTTILAKDNLTSDQIETGALLGGVLSVASSYHVQVQAIDDIGEAADTTITVPTDKVYWHRDGARNSFTFGGYVEEDNTFAIAAGVNFKVKSLAGEDVTVSDTGWIDLGIASTAAESANDVGRNGPGCYYRVINGNHVYVAFNCACELTGENVQLNATAIPAQYRPARAAYAILPTAGRSVIRAFVNTAGLIKIGWLQSLTSGAETDPASVTWVDGYIDYWV